MRQASRPRPRPLNEMRPARAGGRVAGRAALVAGVESASVAGPGFVNLVMSPAWYGEVLAEILRDGDRYGAGTPAPKQRAGRVRVGESDRAVDGRVGAQRRVRRFGRTAAGVRRARRRARVLRERRRRADRRLPRGGRSACSRRGAAAGRLHGGIHGRPCGLGQRSGRAHARGDQGDPRAL